jgi:hypothetical protein
MCDGPDGDLCAEGTSVCNAATSTYVCNDTSSSTTGDRQCNADLDCDGDPYENLSASDCEPISSTRTCDACPGIFGPNAQFETGSQRCDSGCRWTGCAVPRIVGVNSPAALAPWERFLGVPAVGGYRVDTPYTMTSTSTDIIWVSNLSMAPGEYYVTFEHYDHSVFVTPQVRVNVTGAVVEGSNVFSNTVGGYETKAFYLNVTGCANVSITFQALAHFYDGSAGGTAGWYRGGDGIGRVTIEGPL